MALALSNSQMWWRRGRGRVIAYGHRFPRLDTWSRLKFFRPYYLTYFCSVYSFGFNLVERMAFLLSLSSCSNGLVLHLTLPSFLLLYLLNLKQIVQSKQLDLLYLCIYPLTLMEDQGILANPNSKFKAELKKITSYLEPSRVVRF